MVMRAFLVVLALAASSAAEKRTARLADVPPYCVGGRPPKVKWNRLGTSLGNGLVRIDDAWMTTMSLAVAIDRPVIGAWRVLAEYEYLWLGRYD